MSLTRFRCAFFCAVDRRRLRRLLDRAGYLKAGAAVAPRSRLTALLDQAGEASCLPCVPPALQARAMQVAGEARRVAAADAAAALAAAEAAKRAEAAAAAGDAAVPAVLPDDGDGDGLSSFDPRRRRSAV